MLAGHVGVAIQANNTENAAQKRVCTTTTTQLHLFDQFTPELSKHNRTPPGLP